MSKLTERQKEIFNLLIEIREETGSFPTRAEIAKRMGFKSPNAAEDHLRALEKKGAIQIVNGTSRGIRIPKEYTGIPLVGRVAAGEPILAEENIERNYNVDKSVFGKIFDYFLRVCGNSMQDIGILDGDLLAVQSTNSAVNGQIVVARLDDEVTVKRFYQNGSIVTLKPENSTFNPIEIDLNRQNIAIEGIGVGVIRDLN